MKASRTSSASLRGPSSKFVRAINRRNGAKRARFKILIRLDAGKGREEAKLKAEIASLVETQTRVCWRTLGSAARVSVTTLSITSFINDDDA